MNFNDCESTLVITLEKTEGAIKNTIKASTYNKREHCIAVAIYLSRNKGNTQDSDVNLRLFI